MEPQDERPELTDPKPRAPYQRPELKRAGTLRDITANMSPGMDAE